MKYTIFRHKDQLTFLRVDFLEGEVTLSLVSVPEQATIFSEEQLKNFSLGELLRDDDSGLNGSLAVSDFTQHLCQVIVFHKDAN